MSAERRRGESDQLPEEGPQEQAVDDDRTAGARDDAEDQPGSADRDADSPASTGGAGAGE